MLPLFVAGLALSSCTDTWNEHYQSAEAADGGTSLLQLVEQNPQLSDFAKLLHATHLYNNTHATSVTYAQLLDADQTLTVWAPVNGSFNADSLLQICSTPQGDSIVGQHFVGNHIAHHLYNMSGETACQVKMLNNKFLNLTPNALSTAAVNPDQVNTPARNGLLNLLDTEAPYNYNLYEGLTSMERLKHLGTFLKKFEVNELDEANSVVAGIEDGQKVYSDSVMRQENALFRTFDYINSEDSLFAMLVPDAEMWNTVYEEAKPYFNYGSIAKADSVQNYWLNVSLMQDLIYNQNTQHALQDSLTMTSYSTREYPYHVYYKPLEKGGLLDADNFTDTLQFSNGAFYFLKQWPFDKSLYFHPVTVQAENESSMTASKDCTLSKREVEADSVSGNGYLVISPKTSTSNWTVTFDVQNTLAGTYDLTAVILPKTVYNQFSRDTKPNKFTAVVNYIDETGKKCTQEFKTELSNDGTKVDTVTIGRIKLPVAGYQQPDAVVSVQLKCSITSRQLTYSREMYLDCLYLKPIEEE